MLITAARAVRPAKVLVLGAGRLGAVVGGYDVRLSSRTGVKSLGATFIELTSVASANVVGGYVVTGRMLTMFRRGPRGRNWTRSTVTKGLRGLLSRAGKASS